MMGSSVQVQSLVLQVTATHTLDDGSCESQQPGQRRESLVLENESQRPGRGCATWESLGESSASLRAVW